jgi:hypothetical protein
MNDKKVVVIMPAYNAGKTLEKTYREIPLDLVQECIVVDDVSADATVEIARELGLRVFLHQDNQGYGGNQKTCYVEALKTGADIVVMLHPDYQYDPAKIPDLVRPILEDRADIVLGSRMAYAVAGGMPLYKRIANRFLTWCENKVFGLNLSEYHTGFRAFRRTVLDEYPFLLNSNDFIFDQEIIAQAVWFNARIDEISVPHRYFPEASTINLGRSIRYGLGVLRLLTVFILNKTGLLKSRMFRPLHHAYTTLSDHDPGTPDVLPSPSYLQSDLLPQAAPTRKSKSPRDTILALVVALLAGTAFYYSTKAPHHHFDYTYRIAGALVHGQVGLKASPGSWLNELVPFGGKYYSVFPLGAVLVNVPVAVMHELHLLKGDWPARGLAAAVAGGCVYFFYQLSRIVAITRPRRVLLALFPIFATWTWCNLGFAGAWQMALGFCILGQAGALYYTLVSPRPLLAGLWFAVAFGNRTELVVTLPAYLYLWLSRPGETIADSPPAAPRSLWQRFEAWHARWINVRALIAWPKGRQVALFLVVPALLLLATAAYNYARFGSVMDFGYARIPGVMNEPWYRNGLFSLTAIRGNVHEMLFRSMIEIPKFPYYQPHAFGCSIFFACPFLFLLFRDGGKYRAVCWLTIAVLTFILWCHGNAGGWQFSYRYAMILLPWMFVLIAGNGPRRLSVMETALFLFSVFINGMATYQFLWTSMIHV